MILPLYFIAPPHECSGAAGMTEGGWLLEQSFECGPTPQAFEEKKKKKKVIVKQK